MSLNRKQEEFLDLLRPAKQGLWRFCLSMNHSRPCAEEVLSQTIFEAWAGFDKLKDKKAFPRWIFTIARRINIKNLSEQSRFVRPGEEYFDLIAVTDSTELREEIHNLYKALDRLPVEQKEALILFEINGMSRAEVAEIQQSNIETVKKRLAAGREKLKRILTEISQIREYHEEHA